MIYVEDQTIKLNGVLLPGVIKSIEITSTAKIDEQQVEGSATKPKQATGYEDAKINIVLILDDTPTQTKYDRLAVVRALFRKPGQAVPQPIPIVSEDTAAHGISKVLFKGITHKSENSKNQFPVTLEFLEYIPQTIQTQKKKSNSGKPKGSGGSAFTNKYGDYLKNNRGSSPKQSRSPAIDSTSPFTAVFRAMQLPI